MITRGDRGLQNARLTGPFALQGHITRGDRGPQNGRLTGPFALQGHITRGDRGLQNAWPPDNVFLAFYLPPKKWRKPVSASLRLLVIGYWIPSFILPPSPARKYRILLDSRCGRTYCPGRHGTAGISGTPRIETSTTDRASLKPAWEDREMTVRNRQQTMHGLAPVLGVLLALAGGPGGGRTYGAPADAEAGVELFLHSAAEAFMGRDAAKVRTFFAENCAGPLRMPKIANLALTQAMRNAESIDVDFDTTSLKIESGRAFCQVDLNLDFHFKGGNDKQIKGPFILWLDRKGPDWIITDVTEESRDWTVPPGAGTIEWKEDAIHFPVPKGWSAYPIKNPEARRAVQFVSPDLKAIIGVGVVGLPVPFTLQQAVENQKMVDQLFKGSRFVSQNPARLAGSPAVAVGIDHNLGPRRINILNVMMIRGLTLYAVSLAVTPREDFAAFKPVFDRVCAGLTVTGVPKAEQERTVSGLVNKGTYTNLQYGFSISAPAGWKVSPMDDQATSKSGMLFGVMIRAPKGAENYVLAAAKDLPGSVPLDMIQQGQMQGLRAVDPNVTSSDEKSFKIDGLPARIWTYSFKLGKTRKRRQLFVMQGKRLFFVIAEAAPASGFEKLAPDFARIIKSIHFSTPQGK